MYTEKTQRKITVITGSYLDLLDLSLVPIYLKNNVINALKGKSQVHI